MECFVYGGSLRGQAEAIRVALAKNIIKAYPEHTEVIQGF
jgi:ribosomal protein S9